jgi:putative transposase
MPRKNLIRHDRFPYHVTTRTHNQEFFQLPLEAVWKFAQESLREANHLHKVDLIAFVLMNNHYHMLIATPKVNIDLFMYEFNKRLANKIKKETHQINSIFGSRYKWSLIQTNSYYMNCYRYIYQNPLRAKLISRVETYPYSTLHNIVYGIPFPISIHDKFGFKDDFNLEWLNQKISEDEAVSVRKGLKRYLVPF